MRGEKRYKVAMPSQLGTISTREVINETIEYSVAMPSQLGTISTSLQKRQKSFLGSQCPHNSGQFQHSTRKTPLVDKELRRNALTTRDNFNKKRGAFLSPYIGFCRNALTTRDNFNAFLKGLSMLSTKGRRNALTTRDNFN